MTHGSSGLSPSLLTKLLALQSPLTLEALLIAVRHAVVAFLTRELSTFSLQQHNQCREANPLPHRLPSASSSPATGQAGIKPHACLGPLHQLWMHAEKHYLVTRQGSGSTGPDLGNHMFCKPVNFCFNSPQGTPSFKLYTSSGAHWGLLCPNYCTSEATFS